MFLTTKKQTFFLQKFVRNCQRNRFSFEIGCWIRRARYKSRNFELSEIFMIKKKSLDVDKIILYGKFCVPTNICNTNWISQHYIEGITWWKLHDRYWISSFNNLITIPWAIWSRNFRKIIILSTALKVAKFQRITLFSSQIKKKKKCMKSLFVKFWRWDEHTFQDLATFSLITFSGHIIKTKALLQQ